MLKGIIARQSGEWMRHCVVLPRLHLSPGDQPIARRESKWAPSIVACTFDCNRRRIRMKERRNKLDRL
jgi:hypothetical protein